MTHTFEIQNEQNRFLQPGESMGTVGLPQPGNQEWAYGYSYGEIKHSTHEAGNSVLLEVEAYGATEPVLIAEDISLRVKALRGTGFVVIYNTEKDDGGANCGNRS